MTKSLRVDWKIREEALKKIAGICIGNRMKNENITILSIESSCDETAAAVVRNGREVLSNIISSQIALHTIYGGVVPEIASRKHELQVVTFDSGHHVLCKQGNSWEDVEL